MAEQPSRSPPEPVSLQLGTVMSTSLYSLQFFRKNRGRLFRAGLGPTTFRLEVENSIQLSYRNMEVPLIQELSYLVGRTTRSQYR